MSTYHGPGGRNRVPPTPVQPISDGIQRRIGEINAQSAATRAAVEAARPAHEAALREAASERARRAAAQVARETEAGRQAAATYATQNRTAAYMRSEARVTAHYLSANGAEPSVGVNKYRNTFLERCWVIGILHTQTVERQYTYAPDLAVEGKRDQTHVVLRKKPVTGHQYRGIGLLASGELINVEDYAAYYRMGRPSLDAVPDVRRIGDGVVTTDTLVPVSRIGNAEDLPPNQEIAIAFRDQLAILGAHALTGTMGEYAPSHRLVTIQASHPNPALLSSVDAVF